MARSAHELRARFAPLLFAAGAILCAPHPASADPVDPRSLAPLLRAQDFDGLATRLTALESTGARTREGWLAMPRALFSLGVATADDPALAASLDAWRRARPDDWRVEMVTGWRQLLLFHAPRAADGTLDGIEVPGQPDSEARAAARVAFERARTLAPRSPEPGAGLLSIAVLERTPLAERQPMLEQACAADGVCESARMTMLTGLEPHLGGSVEALLGFARQSARDHPGDPNLGLLVGIAHRKAALAFGKPEAYFRDPRAFDEVERAYGDYFAVYPTALRHHNEYARMACWAGRRETARRSFDAIGEAFNAQVWRDDFAEFVERRNWALGVADAGVPARIAP